MDQKHRPGRPRKPEGQRVVRVSVTLRPSTLALVRKAAEEQYAPVSRFIDGVLRERLSTDGDGA